MLKSIKIENSITKTGHLKQHQLNPNFTSYNSSKKLTWQNQVPKFFIPEKSSKPIPYTYNYFNGHKIQKNYQHCRSSLSGVAVNAKHSAGIRVELVNKVWLLLKNLVVLPHEVCPNLKHHNPKISVKKKKEKERERERKKKQKLPEQQWHERGTKSPLRTQLDTLNPKNVNQNPRSETPNPNQIIELVDKAGILILLVGIQRKWSEIWYL